ncbi:MAG: ATP-binding protein [Desulfurococcaceae archaeon]
MEVPEPFEAEVGFIFSEDGVYEPDEITFTVKQGERVEIGDIVAIEHPSRQGALVFYQVTEVPLKRKARDYEEDLAKMGVQLVDPTRDYPRARARQIGYADVALQGSSPNIGELYMLIEHVRPFSKVYRPRPELIDALLRPSGVGVLIGSLYPSWKHRLVLDASRLLRQGLLVVGGVGTGKTTTMLSIIVRLIRALKEAGGSPHVLIIDKDGEYGSRELVETAGEDGYVSISADAISSVDFVDVDMYFERLKRELGFPDMRSSAAKALRSAVESVARDLGTLRLEPDFVERHVLAALKSADPQHWTEVQQRFARWRQRHARREHGHAYGPKEVLEELKARTVVHIDLSATRDFGLAFEFLANLLRMVYDEALKNERFGCVVAIDEAHLFAPEKGGIELSPKARDLGELLNLLATTGARNGVTLFVATQRPSLISKTITTQMGQNIIAHRVEDVDLDRIEEIMGPIARKVRVLPPGWALVKSHAAKIREPIIVRVEPETYPVSKGKTTFERLLQPQG